MTEPFHLDPARVCAGFERAARGYDTAAVLDREVAARMLERLELVKQVPATVLDVGCGTGEATQALAKRYPKARVIGLDRSLGMLAVARRRGTWWRRLPLVCGDAERLPLADASIDLLFSNLLLHWCNEPERVFAEFRRVLRPGGLLMFSTFGPDTLTELRQSWVAADGGRHVHVHRFIDMHDLGDALLRAHLADPVMDAERITLTYAGLDGLFADLRALGARNAAAGRAPGLTGRGRLAALSAAYEQWRR
ncbi:MAG TPA: malonyl-ACP O-methyltransferase BioC, partial [Candidatus Competibacteraceae bacterium]|nr:malonyl-ACP O-methyltransferase BioC [Candidatus Competibacteraceae bacterium]